MVFGFISDGIDAVGGALEDAGEAAVGAIVDIAEEVADTAVDAGGGMFGMLDDTVFDSVDWITGGVVDVDFDGGNFSVGLGIDGVASAGVSVGEDGFSTEASTVAAEMNLSIGPDGFAAGGSGGVAWGPLPYADGHINISDDGVIDIGGHIQGTIPTPVGVLSGAASGSFVRAEDGSWVAAGQAQGTLNVAPGVSVGGGLAVVHGENEDGSFTSASANANVSVEGVGTAGGSAGYQRIEQDGTVIETFNAEGHADVLGVQAAAEVDHVQVEVDGEVLVDDWSGAAAVQGPGGLSYSTEDDVTGGSAAVAATSAGTAAATSSAAVSESVAATDDVAAGVDPGFESAPEVMTFAEPEPVPIVEPEPVPEPVIVEEAEPVDSFDSSLAAADAVETSVDDMFEGL